MIGLEIDRAQLAKLLTDVLESRSGDGRPPLAHLVVGQQGVYEFANVDSLGLRARLVDEAATRGLELLALGLEDLARLALISRLGRLADDAAQKADAVPAEARVALLVQPAPLPALSHWPASSRGERLRPV